MFRFETFGNEGVWINALPLQQDFVATGVTPPTALKLGLAVDSDALDAATLGALGAELKTELTPVNAPLLNSATTTVKLINANAIISRVAKDSNGDGRANHNLDFGTLVATSLSTRAYYPVLQLALQANGGASLGRAPTGLTPTSTGA